MALVAVPFELTTMAGRRLRETVRAVELDRRPLPQLSPGAWQLKERGIEVAAVQLWREVKTQALEVARVAERLSGQVREWLGRTMERLTPGHELAHASPDRGAVRDEGQDLASARHGRRQTPDHTRDACSDLAAQLRAAWEAHQDRPSPDRSPTREPESARSLAERLREAARSIDLDAAAERVASLQQERLAKERQEAERVREQERVRERERREHDRGWDHEL